MDGGESLHDAIDQTHAIYEQSQEIELLREKLKESYCN